MSRKPPTGGSSSALSVAAPTYAAYAAFMAVVEALEPLSPEDRRRVYLAAGVLLEIDRDPRMPAEPSPS